MHKTKQLNHDFTVVQDGKYLEKRHPQPQKPSNIHNKLHVNPFDEHYKFYHIAQCVKPNPFKIGSYLATDPKRRSEEHFFFAKMCCNH